MRVIRLDDSVRPPILIEDQAPVPAPGRGEVLVRVAAAGLTLTELDWYPTTHQKTGEARRGAVPAHEFSGTVAALGEDTSGLAIGQAVYGMNDWYADGALAEYNVAPASALAPKPASLTYVEAAAVPMGALTAWQALFDHAKLQTGERVLVHGGAGAIGVFAVQLAHNRGAHVIATASARNLEFVTSLGADQVIDYQSSRFEETAKDIDVVLDTVGGNTLERSWGVLKPDGRMVTIVSTAEGSNDPRIQQAFFIVEPNQKQLVEIGEQLNAGKLRAVVDSVVPLAEAPEVYAGTVPRLGRGKMVVRVADIPA